MAHATDSPLCVVCHELVGDEPARNAPDYDGVAHARCFSALTRDEADDL